MKKIFDVEIKHDLIPGSNKYYSSFDRFGNTTHELFISQVWVKIKPFYSFTKIDCITVPKLINMFIEQIILKKDTDKIKDRMIAILTNHDFIVLQYVLSIEYLLKSKCFKNLFVKNGKKFRLTKDQKKIFTGFSYKRPIKYSELLKFDHLGIEHGINSDENIFLDRNLYNLFELLICVSPDLKSPYKNTDLEKYSIIKFLDNKPFYKQIAKEAIIRRIDLIMKIKKETKKALKIKNTNIDAIEKVGNAYFSENKEFKKFIDFYYNQ